MGALPFYPVRWALVKQFYRWTAPVRELAKSLNLTQPYPPTVGLGLFSPHFAAKQRDWPPQAQLFGFPFHPAESELSEALERFLMAGPPPVVFTLGSLAVLNAGQFYETAAALCTQLNIRAVMLTGPGVTLPAHPQQIAVEYAPYEKLFPRAIGVVHQGGIGTMAQALRAGLPSLVIPTCNDQVDNAFRAERLGVARVLASPQWKPRSHTLKQLEHWLSDVAMARRAAALGTLIRQENGTSAACDAIESVI